MAELTEEQKGELMDYQALQQQLQVVGMQKQQLAIALAENEAAVKAVESSKGGIYKAAGSVLVEKTKEEALVELKEEKEKLDLRQKVFDKQEKQARDKFAVLSKKLQGDFGKGGETVSG